MDECDYVILNIFEMGFLGELHLLHARQETPEIRGCLGGVLEEPSVYLDGLDLLRVGFGVGIHQGDNLLVVLLKRLMLRIGDRTQMKVVRLGPRVHEHTHEG